MDGLKLLTASERLVVAADFDPDECGGREGVRRKVYELAGVLEGTGITIKFNSALRLLGYGLIEDIHALGLKVFADLKLNDIPQTMAADASLLSEVEPDLLTVMASSGPKGMQAVVNNINPGCEVLAVTVLTSIDELVCLDVYGRSVSDTFFSLASIAGEVKGLGGLVLSGLELEMAKKQFGNRFSLNIPGIRPAEGKVPDDDQKRVSTPAGAIRAGATRLIVGRPITQASDPLVAAQAIIKEIESVTTH